MTAPDAMHGQHQDSVRLALLDAGITGVAALRAAGVRAGVVDLATFSGRGLLPLNLASQVSGISTRQLRRHIRTLESVGAIKTRRTRKGLHTDSLRVRGERYGRLPLSVVQRTPGRPQLWALWGYLDDRDCGSGESVTISDSEVAEDWGMHRATAGRLMRELAAAGLLMLDGRGEERTIMLCAGEPTARRDRAVVADASTTYSPIRPISRHRAQLKGRPDAWRAPSERDRGVVTTTSHLPDAEYMLGMKVRRS